MPPIAKPLAIPVLALILALAPGCYHVAPLAATEEDPDNNIEVDTGGDADSDSDSDSDADVDADADTDADTDSDTDADADSDSDTDTADSLCLRYVDNRMPISGDGLSWQTAFKTIQEGIDDVAGSEESCQVWVAEGRYPIYRSGPRDTVWLKPNVSLFGGFEGWETTLEQRNWLSHPTILDGRQGADDLLSVYHVVTLSAPEATAQAVPAVLDGFTIRGGNAQAIGDNVGGGLFVAAGTAEVRHCTFEENRAGQAGGGIFVTSAGIIRVASSFFFANHAPKGGAVYFRVLLKDGARAVVNSLFSRNSAELGGAITCELIRQSDHAETQQSTDDLQVTVTNSTFALNSASDGGALYTPLTSECQFNVVNSILWHDQPNELPAADQSMFTVTYSAVEGGFDGAGNVDRPPLFKDLDNGNFQLQEASPCIDAAHGPLSPPLDALDRARVDEPSANNTGFGPPWADMGALEHRYY